MAEPTSTYTFSDLYERAGFFLYQVVAKASLSADQTTIAKRMVGAAYNYFMSGAYQPNPRSSPDEFGVHLWSFLRPDTTFAAFPDTTTGAATINGVGNTTLTVAAATFYATMVNATITSDTNGTAYTIAGYTSSKVITLSADASADDGDTFTISATGELAMPETFGGLEGRPALATDETDSPVYLEERAADWIRARKTARYNLTGTPRYYAIEPLTFVEATGQRKQLIVDPTPDSLLIYHAPMIVHWAAMDGDDDYPLGGPMLAATLLECVLMFCEAKDGVEGIHTRNARRLMNSAVATDAKTGLPATLGPIVDPSTQRQRTWPDTRQNVTTA